MRYFSLLKLSLVCLVLTQISCVDTDEWSDVTLGDFEYEIAIPLVNSQLTLTRINDIVEGNTGIRFDPDGRASVFYSGEVLKKTSTAIFPPFPGGIPFLITDTATAVEILPLEQYIIKKAIFKETKINFYFENNLPENVTIDMTIPEVTKNGQPYKQTFKLNYAGSLPVKYQTEDISMDGWTLQTIQNKMTFHYTARTEDGTEIKLDHGQMNFDLIKFSYIEGYVGYHIFPIEGSIIDVRLFDNWLSGTFDFENPKITLSLDNAFGLPVRSKVNKMELTSVTGNTVGLQSPFVDNGIDFLYPSFEEIGQIKTTYFDFNRDNSNIREIFNEKTKYISYDISALVNPDKDSTKIGFVTDDSYFIVNVAAEIPLLGSVNNLVVTDTVDLDLGEISHVNEAELKVIFGNGFPADIRVQVQFLDNSGRVVDELFDGQGLEIEAAPLNESDRVTQPSEKIFFVKMDRDRYDKIKDADKMVVLGHINTTDSDQSRSLWIYDDYGIDVKMGAKLKITKD